MARLWLALSLGFLSAAADAVHTAQCPDDLPGNLNNRRPQTCPLPGHLGIIPDLPPTQISWSHPPRCIAPGTDGNITRLDCLFTSGPFRAGHGISLITSTTTASDLVGQDAFSDRPDPPAARKRTLPGAAYAVVDVPGKGKGVVARRRIRRGEILMVDVPAVLVSVSFLADNRPHHRRRMMKAAVGQLPEETRARVYALARGAEKHEVDQIFGTNTNSVVLGEGEMHVGLFAEVARINHSCRPNAYYRFSQRRLTMEVVAYRTIEMGEEIVMSYTPLAMKHDARRKYLRDNWGFDCGCSLCRASEVEVSDSEGRRRQMNDLRETMLDARSNGYYKDAIAIAGDWLNFSDWEGLPLLMAEYHDVLADLYLLKGDMANATRYARMAVDEWVRFGSVDEARVEAASALLEKLYGMEIRG